jgi:hypothetical protein
MGQTIHVQEHRISPPTGFYGGFRRVRNVVYFMTIVSGLLSNLINLMLYTPESKRFFFWQTTTMIIILFKFNHSI